MKRKALLILVGFAVLGLVAVSASNRKKHPQKQVASVRGPLSVQLVLEGSVCYAILQTSQPAGITIRLHPMDFRFELVDSRGGIIHQSPGYKRSPPLETDWYQLKAGIQRRVFLLPADDYANSGLGNAQYHLKFVMTPADPKSAPHRDGTASPLWKGPDVTSNSIEVVRTNGRFYSRD